MLVIGLDGGTFRLLKPLMDAGVMPELASILQSGCHGELRSTFPPLTPPAWSAFMTGKNPGKHGVVSFRRAPKGYRTGDFINARTLKARTLWEEKGPKDYEYRYTKRIGDGGRAEHYHVVVRGGEVQSVTLNETIQIPRDKLVYYGMPRMFDDIEELLKLDSQPGKPQVFKVAHFAPEDGHLLRYVRRVMGGREWVEIAVDEFKRLDGQGK